MILVIALLNTMYHFLMGPYKAKHQTQYRYDKEYSRSKMLSSMGNICDMLLLIIKKNYVEKNNNTWPIELHCKGAVTFRKLKMG